MDRASPKTPSKPSGRSRRRPRRRRRRPASQAPNAAAALVAPAPLDAHRDTDEPLTAAEVLRMQQHFRFLAKNRKVLRLKLNAQEDLLVNGAKPPSHRGVCQHLLAKVDRATVQSALDRLADAAARTKLLEGVVRFSSDLSLVLAYLESLNESSSRSEAAAALAAGLEQIDFATASPAQMRRVLDLVASLFGPGQLASILFGLLSSPSFESAFDDAIEALPPSLADLVVPLRAVHSVAFRGRWGANEAAAVHRGARLLLRGDAATLRAYPEAARRRLFNLGLSMTEAPGEASLTPSLDTLLHSFGETSRTYSSLALQRIRRLLARHDDAVAQALLQELTAAHPSFRLPRTFLAALTKPRLGRIALQADNADAGSDWAAGFWLDRQQSVWLRRTPTAADAAAQAQVHTELPFLGLAPLADAGGAEDGTGYVAVLRAGTPLRRLLTSNRLSREQLPGLARGGAELLGALAAAGRRLPDADPGRFLLSRSGRLSLADVSGLTVCGVDDALAHHLVLARQWCRAVLEGAAAAEAGPALLEGLDDAADLAALVRTLQLQVPLEGHTNERHSPRLKQ